MPSSRRRRLLKGLQEVDQLMQRKRWPEARDRLEDLDQRYPRRPEVLTGLVNAYYELQDIERYQYACERLLQVDSGNVDAALSLAEAYLTNLRPALALRAFRRFLQRWPDHERAAEVRETVAELEAEMPNWIQEFGVSGDVGWQLALQHEEMQVYMTQGRFRELRQTAEAILRRHPDFAPALNNLGLAHWIAGRTDQAIEAVQRVLTFEPDNIHALANIVHFLCTDGRADEAQMYADRLKASTAPAWKAWTKKAEALSFIGDDEGVLQILHQVQQADETQTEEAQPGATSAMLYHLAAVVTMRIGMRLDAPGRQNSEDKARRYWQQALELQPEFRVAQENLADLDLPVSKRHAPWSFPFDNWISRRTQNDLVRFVAVTDRMDDEDSIGRAARRFLRKHPEIAAMVPTLLERGDKQGREFAMLLARAAHTPELLEALKDFALSQYGPDQLRTEAMHVVSQAGLLPSGMRRLWLEGEWQDAMTMGAEIHGEPLTEYPPQVDRWLREARSALYESDGARAESALMKALAVYPEDPSLLNNLSIAFNLQGRYEEADALLQQIYERYPDYLFARSRMAQRHVERGEFEEARHLLESLMQRERMHYSEFDSFCGAFIQLYLAEGKVDVARTWFKMWEEIDPDNPKLEALRRQVAM